MDIYLAGSQVNLNIPLVDRNGNPLTVDSISYRVVDQANVEIIPSTALVGFVAGSASASIVVPATDNVLAVIPANITNNQIDLYNTREVRTVELSLVIAGNTMVMTKSYGIEPVDPLYVGLNSFQSFAAAELISLDIPNLTAWNTASDTDKIAALIDARVRICQLNFWLLNSNINWGQDSLSYVPEGQYNTPYVSGGNSLFIFNGNLSLLNPTQFSYLPIRFKVALCKAQLAEADEIMGGDPVSARRREGLMLESIGEVKQMFRAGKPLDLPVSSRALKYLSQFVSFSKRISRS